MVYNLYANRLRQKLEQSGKVHFRFRQVVVACALDQHDSSLTPEGRRGIFKQIDRVLRVNCLVVCAMEHQDRAAHLADPLSVVKGVAQPEDAGGRAATLKSAGWQHGTEPRSKWGV